MHRCVVFVAVLAASGALSASIVDPSPTPGDQDWWKHGIFYQIYPRSFMDSNNDGIGDLKGILQRIDHLKDTGVTAVWLSPIYKSPQVDQGYDISDYRSIEPDYGTLDDLKALVKKLKELGIKIIMDLVPNHTSDQHEWFQKSVKGEDKYKDYYVWHDGKKNEKTNKIEPPNNWVSVFSNSAWTWNESRKQFYLHQFAPQQPDLNYRNPEVRKEIQAVIEFWLDLGIDGFRIDAVPFLIEDESLKDEPRSQNTNLPPTDYGYLDHIYTVDQDGTFDVVYEWREVVDKYTKKNGGDARVLMTEAYTNMNHTMLYYGNKDGSKLGAHFSFNFNLITDINNVSLAEDWVNAVRKWLHAIPEGYVSNWVLGNHDQHRVATRLGKNNVDGLNMLMALLPGVGVTYNGEEIGMENGEVKYDEGKDPSARDPKEFEAKSRDFERTPFQWDTSNKNAGFNTNDAIKPWLPVSKKYRETNLKDQNVAHQKTHYNVYKELLTFRKTDVPAKGDTTIMSVAHVVILKRELKDDAVVLVHNIKEERRIVSIGSLVDDAELEVVVTDIQSKRNKGDKVQSTGFILEGNEALVLQKIKKTK